MKFCLYAPLSNLSPFYTSLPVDLLSGAYIHIVSRSSFLIAFAGHDFEIVSHMNCIDNAVFAYYKILSSLFLLIRNMDIFLLITQAS